MEGNKLFRKAALEKLSSPERLDVMMRVTSPGGWVALGGVGFILVAVIVWSVVGNIAIKVEGKGILIRGGAVLDVDSEGQGRVTQVLVKTGEVVKSGQVVAKLSQPDLALKIENIKEEIRALSGQGNEQRAAQSRLIGRYQQQAQELREKIANQQKMVERGLLTRSQLMDTQQQLTSTEQQIAQLQVTNAGMGNRVDDLRRQQRELESQLALTSDVTSPYDGRVLEVMVNPGDLIQAGTRVLSLEQSQGAIKAIIYIPAQDGKKVRPGMRAYVSPSTVQPAEYGFMIGEVSQVSEYPMTAEGLLRVLRNEKLVESLTGRTVPIEVQATLIPDPSTPSGFKWSSSKGPPTKVFSGTLCNASVQVETKRPIAYVLPIFKNAVGAS
ncbi:MAG: NHLP bacteriocin system secretion protein [Acidobacteriota bacterium]